MGPTISLTISSALIILLLVLKHVEMRRGMRFAEEARKRLDDFALKSLPFLIHTLPQLSAFYTRRFAVSFAHVVSAALLSVVRFSESKLHRFHSIIKGRRDLEHKKAPSEFLNNVSEHKEAISKERENGTHG